MNSYILVLIKIVVFNINFNHIISECPDGKLIAPCSCDNGQIWCQGPEIKELDSFGTKLKSNQRKFKSLTIYKTGIIELKESAFEATLFNIISLENNNQLEAIHKNAFDLTYSYTTVLNVLSNTRLKFNKTIFEFVNRFKKLQVLNLRETQLERIPVNCFENSLNTLSFVELIEPRLKVIEDKAFTSLSSLTQLRLGLTQIDTFTERALEMSKDRHWILIELVDNPFINGKSFSNNTLLNIERTVSIGLINQDQPLDYLDQKEFEPFLRKNAKNTINVTILNCSDCRNLWLNDSTIIKQIFAFDEFGINRNLCSNGKKLNDSDNFYECY